MFSPLPGGRAVGGMHSTNQTLASLGSMWAVCGGLFRRAGHPASLVPHHSAATGYGSDGLSRARPHRTGGRHHQPSNRDPFQHQTADGPTQQLGVQVSSWGVAVAAPWGRRGTEPGFGLVDMARFNFITELVVVCSTSWPYGA
jgi:hypothetical protein